MIDNKEKGEYMQKEDLSYWFPVSHDVASMIEELRKDPSNYTKGIFTAPFQMIEICVTREYVKLKASQNGDL